MKTHGGRDKGIPCIYQHTYICPICENEFSVDEDTHWRHPSSGKVFSSLFWPACSYICLTKQLVRPDLLILDQIVMDAISTAAEISILWDYIPMIEQDEGDLVE